MKQLYTMKNICSGKDFYHVIVKVANYSFLQLKKSQNNNGKRVSNVDIFLCLCNLLKARCYRFLQHLFNREEI